MEKIPINSCSFSDLLRVPGIDNCLGKVILTLRQRHNGLSLSLLHRFIRPIVPAYWQAICQCFDFSPYTTDPRRSSTKTLTYSDNYDRRHQSGDDNDQFYPSSHVARPNSKVLRNHARTDASLQKEYPGSLSLVSPGHSDFRQARDTFAPGPADYPRSAERTSSRPVTLPRTITFDGSGSWHVFIAKFISFADECNWSFRQRKTQLSWCLVGKVSEYYASLLEREPGLDFSGITRKLQAHFELPEISQMRFTYAQQRNDESLTEWADRLSTLAMQAFPGLPEEHLQRQVIMRFCQGSNSNNRKAAQFAINSRPKTLDEALYLVRLYRYKYRTQHGRLKKDAFQHSSEAWPSESKRSAYDSQHGRLKKDAFQHPSEAWPSESKRSAYDSQHGRLKKDAFQHSSEAWPSESKRSAYDSQHGKLKKDVSQHSSEALPSESKREAYDFPHGKLKKNVPQHSSEALPSESSFPTSQPFIRQGNLCKQKTKPEVVLQNLDIKVDTLVSNFNVQETQLNYLETRVDSLSSRVESVQENTDSILHEIDTLKNLVQGVALSVNELGYCNKYQQLCSCQCTSSDEHKDRPKDSSGDSAFFASDAGSFQELVDGPPPSDFPKSNNAISPSLITAKDDNPLSSPHVTENRDGGMASEGLSPSPTLTDDVRVIPPVLASSPVLKVEVNLAPPKTSQSFGCEGGRPTPTRVRTDGPPPDGSESSRRPPSPTCPWVLPPWPPP